MKKLEVSICRCPDCNNKLEPNQERCEYCDAPLIWTETETGLHIRIDVTDDRDEKIDRDSGKPIAYITGRNGNVFTSLSICKRALHANNQYKEADEMFKRVLKSKSWDEAIDIMNEYVVLA